MEIGATVNPAGNVAIIDDAQMRDALSFQPGTAEYRIV